MAAKSAGAFYNNQKNPSKPLKVAIKPISQWSLPRIIMTKDKAACISTVNWSARRCWKTTGAARPFSQRSDPVLQNHGDQLWFKNIYIRELGPQ
jgi:hypothetical protein